MKIITVFVFSKTTLRISLVIITYRKKVRVIADCRELPNEELLTKYQPDRQIKEDEMRKTYSMPESYEKRVRVFLWQI